MSTRLDTLLSDHPALWRADAQARARRVAVPTGHAGLDARLPGGGWLVPALIEVLHEQPGVGELRLFVPLLRHLGRAGASCTAALTSALGWIDPPHMPYAPALGAWELDPARQLIVRTASPAQGLWAMEQALRSGACCAVLGWMDQASMQWLRRLKLAAMESGGVGILYRSLRWRAQPSPASIRLALEDDEGLRLHLLKVQGGQPGWLPWQ